MKPELPRASYSVSTNLLPRFFMTCGRVVYSMSSMGRQCGSKGYED
jgi:hypothetical protein